MWAGIAQIQSAIQLFLRHKVLLVPYLAFWVCFYGLLRFSLDFVAILPVWTRLLLLWYVPVILFTIACFTLLELIEQIESGRQMNLLRAVGSAVSRDLLWSLPIILLWSIVGTLAWILLFPIALLTRGATNSLQKRIRLSILFVLPAIAWEQVAPWQAVQKGSYAVGKHWEEFVKSFGIADLFWKVVSWWFLVVLFGMQWLSGSIPQSRAVEIGVNILLPLTILFPFVFSFMIYLEQLVAAELYLWHLRWRKAVAIKSAKRRSPPSLFQLERPSLLNEIPELLDIFTPIENTESNPASTGRKWNALPAE